MKNGDVGYNQNRSNVNHTFKEERKESLYEEEAHCPLAALDSHACLPAALLFQPEDTPSPTPTGEAAVEDGYIPAPYTADASQSPTEYVASCVLPQRGRPHHQRHLQRRDRGGQASTSAISDNDQELDPFEDCSLSTEERPPSLLGKMNPEQRIAC